MLLRLVIAELAYFYEPSSYYNMCHTHYTMHNYSFAGSLSDWIIVSLDFVGSSTNAKYVFTMLN